VKRKTVVRNAALLSALLLLVGVLVPLAHAEIRTTGVLSTGSHRVVIDSLEIMDVGGGIARYRTAGEWSGDTMVVDSFVCTPGMGFFPMLVMTWGSLDGSPFTRPIPSILPDTWYIINSAPQEAKLWFHWIDTVGVKEHSRQVLERAGLTVSPSIVRAGTTIRAERVAGPSTAFLFFDAAGNRVRTLKTQASPAGAASATWNGEDDLGRRLPEGIYYCRLDDAASPSARKLILSR
jgi:hypothetical protein